MRPDHVLILPGWQNSGPDHWQSRWEALYGYRRVEQHDWTQPLRGDWVAQLEATVRDALEPVTLVAHSLGCIQIAAWAAVSPSTRRVRAALLVAPGDVERNDLRDTLPSWVPIHRQPLPFPSVLVGSRNDPYCTWERAKGLGTSWGSLCVDGGAMGHINADSGLGDWAQGHTLLQSLITRSDAP